jgi:putative endonuclease
MPRRSGEAAKAGRFWQILPVLPAGYVAETALVSARAPIPRHSLIPASASALPALSAMPGDKRFVYVLKNADSNSRFYVGLTSDVRGRLQDHNAGRCPHTSPYRPWQLHVVMEFADEPPAVRFERYLKSGSGRAFANRHFG